MESSGGGIVSANRSLRNERPSVSLYSYSHCLDFSIVCNVHEHWSKTYLSASRLFHRLVPRYPICHRHLWISAFLLGCLVSSVHAHLLGNDGVQPTFPGIVFNVLSISRLRQQTHVDNHPTLHRIYSLFDCHYLLPSSSILSTTSNCILHLQCHLHLDYSLNRHLLLSQA